MDNLSLWTKEDYYTYFLIYAANADYMVVEEEKEYILDKVSSREYKKINRVFNKHNDIQRIETFDYFLDTYCQTEESRLKIFSEMKELFWVDGNYASAEQIFFMHFKKMINEGSSKVFKELIG